MDCRLGFAILTIYALCLGSVMSEEGKACDLFNLKEPFSCGPNETCVSDVGAGRASGICRCKTDFSRASRALDAPCIPKKTSSAQSFNAPSDISTPPDHTPVAEGHGGSGASSGDGDNQQRSSVSTGAVTAAVLVPLIVAVGALLVIGARRFRWAERVRRLRGSRYEEVRIGQEDDDDEDDDDPPLA